MRIERPVFIIGAPRSGTTLVFTILSASRKLWSFYQESEYILKNVTQCMQTNSGHHISPDDVSKIEKEEIYYRYYKYSMNYQLVLRNLATKIITSTVQEYFERKIIGGISKIYKKGNIRLVEKNPKNSLRIELIESIFPDALYIYLVRDPVTNINSLIGGWNSGRNIFADKKSPDVAISGYYGKKWCFLYPPNWMSYINNKTLEEVCAFQYGKSNEYAFRSLEKLPDNRVLRVHYEELIERPYDVIENICNYCDIPFDSVIKKLASNLPVVNAVTRPDKNKWKTRKKEIDSVLPSIKGITRKLGYS